MKKIAICVNGILVNPGDANGWTDRAVTWLHTTRDDVAAEKFEYFVGALTRRFRLNSIARNFAELLQKYGANHELHIIGHSNGGEVITRAIRHLLTESKSRVELNIKSIHLCAPANAADFAANWLNIALGLGLVKSVFVYRARKDKALMLGRVSRRLFGWLGLGYGDLGLVGPQNVDERYAARVIDIPNVVEGHTDFFTEANFENTMQRIGLNI
jgi:esterase/lipase superfamily enzyme